MPSDSSKTIDALNDLLEAEREALLAGNLDKLVGLFSLKTSLIEALNDAEKSETQDFQLLDAKIKRNQELLSNALAGIRKVARRMAAFRRVRASLETYDSKGCKSVIDIELSKSLEKRA